MESVVLVTLNPGGIIAWIVVGLVAGWLAGRVMSGGGFGCLGNLVVGLIGALVGGFIVSLFVNNNKTYGVLGSIVVSVIGACVLLAIVHLLRGQSIRT